MLLPKNAILVSVALENIVHSFFDSRLNIKQYVYSHLYLHSEWTDLGTSKGAGRKYIFNVYLSR